MAHTKFSTCCLVAAASLSLGATAHAEVVIGSFAGGVAEAGWGRFQNGVQPLDASVFTVTDLDTNGDGGALETNIAGFSDSFAYSFSTAGTSEAFFANDTLVFDLIYRGEATDDEGGGFSQVFQVLFQSDFNNFALQAITTSADGVDLSDFAEGGTSVGWGPGDAEEPTTVLNVAIDYSDFRDNLLANGVGPDNLPSTLQFWMSTNDDNRPFKAIDNVRLVPEPASLALLGLGALAVASRRRA